MKNILAIVLFVSMLSSCNKWLDVQPEKQIASDKLFETQSGFYDALNGCYIKLKSRDLYGEKLTMTNIESLAHLWQLTQTGHPADYELNEFNYDGDYAKNSLSAIYSGLFNVIAQANMIIKNIETKGEVIPDQGIRAMIEGEAYAIRALCHMDLLRLFGQVPTNATIQVSLPYAELVSATDLPSYYAYNEYIQKLNSDLIKAEELLKDNDPIFKYTFQYLNNFSSTEISDQFLGYRQNRLNYWSVKALQARLSLYTGDNQKAYSIASEILNAKNVEGNPLITLSGSADIASGYYASPGESLFMLNSFSLMTYVTNIFGAGATQVRTTNYVITQEQLNEMFENEGMASNIKYNSIWSKSITDPFGQVFPVLMKYFHDTQASTTGSVNMTKRQVIPIIRLSEIYLIAIETTSSLGEANKLWKEYKLSHNVLVTTDPFMSLNDVKQRVIDEYRREFYGEGLMFYTYKRNNIANMKWRDKSVNELDYIIPLPQSEFNPNN